MLSTKQMLALGARHRRYLEGCIYIECLTHSIKKVPILEFGEGREIYYNAGGNHIHIGVGAIEAEDEKDFFEQCFFLLGHELQHMLSTTQKDWEAALKMCHREACQRLSVKVFGRARRLTKDSDYEAFFRELADKDIYVNQQMLMNFAHFICNSLEDGRIENLRQVKHPGFGDYRRLWNGKQWIKESVKDAPFFEEDPEDLNAYGEMATIMNQFLSLALHGVYQKDFLAAYEGTKLHRRVESYIPDIARAVLARSCKGCMDQARSLFTRLLDLLLDVCTCEMTAQQIEQLIKDLLDKLMNEAENAQMSATPNTEEQGEGIPAPSLFGQSDLEIEVTQEEYDEMMKDADDSSTPGIKIKVKDEDEADEAEEADGKDSSEDGSSAEADKNAENSPSASENTGGDEGDEGEGDGEGESQGASEKSGESRKEDKSEGGKEENGTSAGNEGESIDSPSDQTEEGNSSGEAMSAESADNKSSVNNRSEGTSEKSSKDMEEEIKKAMEEAAQNVKADYDFAEADAKADEKFREAAANFKAVNPAEVNMTPVNSHYDYDVEFIEATRVYAPTLRLPLELENKGKSLDRAVDQLIKNKQDPDLRFLRSGKLDTRRIANLAMGDINVFKKPGEPVRSDVAGYLLMDNSGSMGNGPGSTRFACCNAFAVLEEGFKNHMPIKIAAFDAWGNEQVSHEVIKEFDEVSEANLSYNFRDLGRSGGGNKDGYSIRVATQQLLHRDEKDKILIIASDGFPTEYYGGHSEGCADVKAAVEDARKAGIRTIGMYMYHEQNESDFATFQDMYGPEIIFASLDEIEDELVRILKRYF